jgi:enoyl-CoA hydratase
MLTESSPARRSQVPSEEHEYADVKTYPTLLITGSGPVRHMVFNRPEIHNAFSMQSCRDVEDACLDLDRDPDVRVVIVRGAGKSLSAGGELKEFGLSTKQFMQWARDGVRMMDRLTNMSAITICCCHGHMIGSGAILPTACDFRIGSPSIRMKINEVAIGFNLTWNALPPLIQLVGPAKAKEMLLFARTYLASDLLTIGYLNEVVDDADLIPTAERYAADILRQPPVTVAVTKASINAYSKALDRSVQHMDFIASGFMSKSPNTEIARSSYFNKTDPEYVDE